ncbi:DUF397 domain-containing protein [Streptomyces noursei]|uniref:DUF397 domain-containing protein n=1 Tax=Streptomyces noursei TaxID=1971 RepID=UPI001671CE2F|nr:DUF397 domain-containing protein [Streptomyces noursei]MCZ1015638.1 DUF397 domain-containing protein [Streptomyces noursei]GGW89667.1 hypothetical protein GCM10010341_08150 [Streptomyces noursei]
MNETPNWHKSSYSSGGSNDCVEVANNLARIMVRDSKLTSNSPEISATPDAWTAFLRYVKPTDTV